MSKEDFKDCIFDVNKFGGKVSIQDAYPELLAYKEYLSIPGEAWKVAILSVDMGSPYSKIKDMKKKVPSVFESLGIDKNKHKNLFRDAMEHRSGDLMDACSFLLEYQNDTDFATWYQKCRAFYDIMRLIDAPMGDMQEDKYYEIRFKRQDMLSKLSGEIRELDVKLFGSVAMKNAAYRSKKKMERNYAEKYAMENQVE